MKQLLMVLVGVLITGGIYGQVLEKKYPAGGGFRYVKLSSGEYYVSQTYPTSDRSIVSIKLYYPSHSLYKSLLINVQPNAGRTVSNVSFRHITDKVYDSDDLIEIGMSIGYSSGSFYSGSFSTFKEGIGEIFRKDSVADYGGLSTSYKNYSLSFIGEVNGEAKLTLFSTAKKEGAIWSNNDLLDPVPLVYALSGSLPLALNQESNPFHYGMKLSPNPATTDTKVEYAFPASENTGEILVYNSSGLKVKSYKVDNSFDHLLLNNSDLPSGTYFYNLISGGKLIDRKKSLIIK